MVFWWQDCLATIPPDLDLDGDRGVDYDDDLASSIFDPNSMCIVRA